MDLWDLLRVLVRRWWVTVPLLALTAVAAVTLGGRQSTTYDGTASLLLVLPANDGSNGEQVVNPLTVLGVGAPFGSLVGTVLDSPETRDAVEQAGGSRDFELAQGKGSPTLVVTVQAASDQVARQTVESVLAEARQSIQQLQDEIDVPQGQRLAGRVVVEPVVTATVSSSTRVLLAVAAAGLLITALVALAVEALLSTRRRRSVTPAQR